MFPSDNNSSPFYKDQQKLQQGLNQNGGSYQIKTGDTFDSIAQNTGFTPQDIQGANNGMLIPPPKGSYITLPGGSMGTPDFTVSANQQAAPFYTQAQLPQGTNSVSPYRPGGITGKPPVGYGPQQARPATPGVPMNQAGYPSYSPVGIAAQAQAQANDLAVQNTITSLQAGVLPPNISSYAANNLVNPTTGQKFTPQDLAISGYSFNPATGQYTLTGAQEILAQNKSPNVNPNGGGGSDFSNTASQQYYAANGVAFQNQKRWDPERKKFVKIGQLLKEGRLDIKTGRMRKSKGGGGGQPQAPVEPQGTTSAPTQQLNTNQGGG